MLVNFLYKKKNKKYINYFVYNIFGINIDYKLLIIKIY